MDGDNTTDSGNVIDFRTKMGAAEVSCTSIVLMIWDRLKMGNGTSTVHVVKDLRTFLVGVTAHWPSHLGFLLRFPLSPLVLFETMNLKKI